MSDERPYLTPREEKQLPIVQCIPPNKISYWECRKRPLHESYACGMKMSLSELACQNNKCRKNRGENDFALNSDGQRIGRLVDWGHFRRWPADKQGHETTMSFSPEKEAVMLKGLGMSPSDRGRICGQEEATVVQWPVGQEPMFGLGMAGPRRVEEQKAVKRKDVVDRQEEEEIHDVGAAAMFLFLGDTLISEEDEAALPTSELDRSKTLHWKCMHKPGEDRAEVCAHVNAVEDIYCQKCGWARLSEALATDARGRAHGRFVSIWSVKYWPAGTTGIRPRAADRRYTL
ncbi:hypothetical protein B0I35DRAFT_478786 [Stachybotrys elegans]|uniref:Uncharacterized protein n=1 Tax=Stachybotrys elegans TaxID=80388 RepID=A0A8K0WS96_9HYPO|nr:hypothetical protein B0I35DRAFT_478786 [Stachybotrys elegans]